MKNLIITLSIALNIILLLFLFETHLKASKNSQCIGEVSQLKGMVESLVKKEDTIPALKQSMEEKFMAVNNLITELPKPEKVNLARVENKLSSLIKEQNSVKSAVSDGIGQLNDKVDTVAKKQEEAPKVIIERIPVEAPKCQNEESYNSCLSKKENEWSKTCMNLKKPKQKEKNKVIKEKGQTINESVYITEIPRENPICEDKTKFLGACMNYCFAK